VSAAVATQLALEALTTRDDAPLLFRVGSVHTMHHARFAREDRRRLDIAIEGRFGKRAPARPGVVAIATQTVQQSLDLDADFMLTDLAPMDVLLQRFGRLHRHPEHRDPDRPSAFVTPRVVVMTGDAPLEDSLGASGQARGKNGVGTVYEDVVILEATRRRLARAPRLVIPSQNRELVEVTTHPDALDELAHTLGPVWEKHRAKVCGVERAHAGLAHLNLVERDQRFGQYSFKRSELEERIAARLGESDRRAVFGEPFPRGPFGEPLRELTLPGWLVREAPPDPDLVPTDVRLEARPAGTATRFLFGPMHFVYDRLGLRRESGRADELDPDQADA
jgi:CRISPR-associated endonuclease/helicase Cas3